LGTAWPEANAMMPYRTFRPPHLLSSPLREFLLSEDGRDFISITSLLPATWNAVVMGGLLRDFAMEQLARIPTKPADMDLVIFGAASVDEISLRLGNVVRSRNSFGGVKCSLREGGMVFDLWRVEDHTNIARTSVPHTIEQLLRHNLVDVDAILWEPKTDSLHDCGCIQAVEKRSISLMGAAGISQKFPAAQVAHVLLIAHKTGFALADDVRAFVVDASARCGPAEIESTLARKMPHDAAQIEALWSDILSGGGKTWPVPTRSRAQ
jgi:hypothetical protein